MLSLGLGGQTVALPPRPTLELGFGPPLPPNVGGRVVEVPCFGEGRLEEEPVGGKYIPVFMIQNFFRIIKRYASLFDESTFDFSMNLLLIFR